MSSTPRNAAQETEADAEPDATPGAPERRFSLGQQILLGLTLGIAVGLFFGDLAGSLEIVGVGFIRLLQITVIPYISVALITGLGRLEFDDVKRLVVKGGAVLLLLWLATITLIALLELAFPDWPTRSLFQKSSVDPVDPPDFLQLYIPSNPFFSLANGIVPAVVVFSVMIGLALTGSKNKHVLIDPLMLLGEVLSKMTSFIAKLAPFGVFALMANTSGTMSFDDLARLQVYVVIMILLLMILGLWLLPGFISCVTTLGHREVLQRLRTPLLTAFATGSSLVVLPMLAELCKTLLAEHQSRALEQSADEAEDSGEEEERDLTVAEEIVRSEEEQQEEVERTEESMSTVDVLIPTFYSFPTAGNVMALGFVFFAGWYIGAPVASSDYPAVIAAGLVSLFGGASLAIPFTLGLAELPRSLFQVFLSIDVIVARFATFVSVAHYATIALVGSFALAGSLQVQYGRLLRLLLVSTVLIAAALLGVRAFYTHVVVVPYTMDEYLRGLNKLDEPAPYLIYRSVEDVPTGSDTERPRALTEIVESGVLRACYSQGNYPLSFFNNAGDLVGFDIEMAHRFADRLGVMLVLVPRDEPDDLMTGYCDVRFNSQAMVLNRPEGVYTDPFDTITLSLVVPTGRRSEFSTWAELRAQEEITIALSPFQALQSELLRRVPQATPVPLTSLAAQRQHFESGGVGADAFLDAAEEGAAWTVLFPRFSVVVPRPVVQLPVAYLLARDNASLRSALNEWLQLERASGELKVIYDYWVQGDTRQVQPPRWSILRDVLGWVP